MRFTLTLLLLCILLIETSGQADSLALDMKIPTPAEGSTSKTIIESLIHNYDILITYQSNDPVLDYPVQMPKVDSITLKELLHILQQNLPYEFLNKNGYIILKRKAMPKLFELKGTVKSANDDDNPVFANVLVKETYSGQPSNEAGEYSLKLVPGNYVIEYSCIGFKTTYRNINLYNDLELHVTLQEELYQIEAAEVRRTREKVLEEYETGRNIERIDAKTISQMNLNNPTDVLQGRINGVWVTSISGAPGDHQKVRIRGINSLFAAVDPLYVVNGVQVPIVNLNSLGIADININDIESITVLKDVASTAYYGFQGGNGVVKIETKKGGGENLIHFRSRFGLQKMKKRYPLMNNSEFLHTMVKIDSVYPSRHKTFPRYFTYYDLNQGEIDRFVYPFPTDMEENMGTDWQEELFQTGVIQEYQLALQGLKKKINYYVSGNYYDHDGVVVNSNYKKYSYSANLGVSPFKNFHLDFSGFGSVRQNENSLDNYLGNKVILQAINIEPGYNSLTKFEKLRLRGYPNSDGSPDVFGMNRPQEMYAFISSLMPDLYINKLTNGQDFFSLRNQTQDVLSNNFSLGLNYHIHPDLSVTNRSSLTFKEYSYESLIQRDSTFQGAKYYHSTENYRVINNVLSIDYSKLLVNHAFRLSASYRFYRDQVKWDVDSVYGFNLDEIDKSTDGYIRGSNAFYGQSGNVVRDINSLILHAKYAYKNKYTLSAFANFDQLKEGNSVNLRDVFPSVAVNWDISKETGLNSINALNELSLYVNWGLSGNYPLNSLSNDLYAERRLSNGQDLTERGIYIANIANHRLKHEEVEEVNLGLKLHAFQNRFFINANYYIKENRNLIIDREIPLYYGGGIFMKNLGIMKHNGIEISLEADIVERVNFSWNTVLGYSSDKQRVSELYEDHDTLLFNSSELLIPNFYIAKDAQIGDIVGYKYEGYWTEMDEEMATVNYVNHKGIKYYKNDTLSSELGDEDKVVIGNSIPDFTCFWINGFRYKNLSINMHWYAVLGVDKFNSTRATTYFTQVNREIGPFVQDSLSFFMDPKFYESSYFIEDASFVRLKSLSFVYNPRKPLFGNVKASFSLSFENLITLSRYKGYDPEATTYTDNNFSDNAIDIGAYPSPRSIFLGIDFTF